MGTLAFQESEVGFRHGARGDVQDGAVGGAAVLGVDGVDGVAVPEHVVARLDAGDRGHGVFELEVGVSGWVVFLSRGGHAAGKRGGLNVERVWASVEIEERAEDEVSGGMAEDGAHAERALARPRRGHGQPALEEAEHAAGSATVVEAHVGVDTVAGVEGIVAFPVAL